MRVRTAKKLAQRIDLYYFTHAHGMRRWRILLSIALPIAAVIWVSGLAAAGSRKAYSAGPVSSAHAFAETKCEACHGGGRAAAVPPPMFRAHTTEAACLTCHDAPAHAANQTPPPGCAACHQEHRGRVQLARTDDRLCVDCHGSLHTTQGDPKVARQVREFPAGHPEFAAVRLGTAGTAGTQDPAHLQFNHAVHMKDALRGPGGPEKLECATCHKPEVARTASPGKRPQRTGLMSPITYQENCARCHPLFFDERIDQAAPHAKPDAVHSFVQQALLTYIRNNPNDINTPDTAFRRVPLNFPRPAEPPARNAQEWVSRRLAADERLLWNKTCAECHSRDTAVPAPASDLPAYAATNVTKQWMPRASFDHSPHLMVKCADCHAAQGSTRTSDVLMPNQAVCATCHAPEKGAESRCFECHRYHDWTKARPVVAPYSLGDFR